MEKYLYFAKGDGANATSAICCISLRNTFRGAGMLLALL